MDNPKKMELLTDAWRGVWDLSLAHLLAAGRRALPKARGLNPTPRALLPFFTQSASENLERFLFHIISAAVRA